MPIKLGHYSLCSSLDTPPNARNIGDVENRHINSALAARKFWFFAAALFIASCGTATFTKTGSNATIESLRSFHLAFIDEFAVTGRKFNATAFNAKVNEGNAKFQQAIADDKFTARRPVFVDLKAQFDADAAHLKSKASHGKITPALASEMKKDVNKIYDHALGR